MKGYRALILATILAAAAPCLAQHDAASHPAQPQAAPPPAEQVDHSQHAAPPAAPAEPDPRPQFFRGKAYSEFSHRMAGVFVFLAGFFYLMSAPLARRWPAVRFAWPLCLLLPGLYLIIFSDPKWPFGPVGFFELFRTNAEFQQHKIYATILICLGLFEWARTRGAIRGTWAAFVFPALGVIGAVLLLFHPHGAGEHSPEHMAAMGKIQGQHIMFFVVGLGIAVTKALSEIQWKPQRIFLRAWPMLMIALGVMLVFYSE